MKRFFRYLNPLKRSFDTIGRSVSVSEARKVGTSPTFAFHTSKKRQCPRIVFFSKESWAHLLPPNFQVLSYRTDCSGQWMLLPTYHISHSSIIYILCCHCLVHVMKSVWVACRVSSKQSNFFFGSNRNKPKLNLFRLFFGLFHETQNFFFRFVSVCFGVSDRYRNNRNKPKKPLNKALYQGILKTINFFSVRTETNRNSICFGCFSVSFFRETPQKNFRFVSVFWTGIETTETNRTYGMGN